MDYDLSKEELSQVAKLHTAKVRVKYKKEIQLSIEGTRCYIPSNLKSVKANQIKSKVSLVGMSTVWCAFRHIDDRDRAAILSFASYRTPGGGFITGGNSQEESICHDSTLYPVLKHFDKEYYAYNREHTNNGLNGSRMLYVPGVVLDQDGYAITKKVDVISFASVDFPLLKKHEAYTYQVNHDTMQERILDIFRVATLRKIDTLILGAWGCGSCGQDAYEIAQLMIQGLEQYPIQRVFFAIPDVDSDNYLDFWAALDEAGYPVPDIDKKDENGEGKLIEFKKDIEKNFDQENINNVRDQILHGR